MSWHRDHVGGLWDEIGRLQFDFMVERGLMPHHRFLDIGCGCLRGGVHFIRYLDAGNYYGVDADAGLIKAGEEEEIPTAKIDGRNPHFLCNEDFNFSTFQTTFDFMIAHSLFTHLKEDEIERCLKSVESVIEEDGKLYATYFGSSCRPHPSYWYEPKHLSDIAYRASLAARDIGEWGHPRKQRMMEFAKP
jgi:SAM-dependent methyltransferase